MGWLLGPSIASLFIALVAMYLYRHITAGIHSGLAGIGQLVLFVSTWTFVTVYSLDQKMGWLKGKSKGVGREKKTFLTSKKFW